MTNKHYIKDYDTFKSTLIHELCHLLFIEQLPYHKIEGLHIWAQYNLENEHCFFAGNVVTTSYRVNDEYLIPEIEVCLAGYYGAKIICGFEDKSPSTSDFDKAYSYANIYVNKYVKDFTENDIEELIQKCILHVEEEIRKNHLVIEYIANHVLNDIQDFEVRTDKGITISKYIIDKYTNQYFNTKS